MGLQICKSQLVEWAKIGHRSASAMHQGFILLTLPLCSRLLDFKSSQTSGPDYRRPNPWRSLPLVYDSWVLPTNFTRSAMLGSRGYLQSPPLAISGYLHYQNIRVAFQLSSARCIMYIVLVRNYPLSINATGFQLSLTLRLDLGSSLQLRSHTHKSKLSLLKMVCMDFCTRAIEL